MRRLRFLFMLPVAGREIGGNGMAPVLDFIDQAERIAGMRRLILEEPGALGQPRGNGGGPARWN
jgi:hypothetical protein